MKAQYQTIERYLRDSLIVSFLVLLALCCLGFVGVRRFINAGRWVAHTQVVLSQLENALASANDVILTARGYVITMQPILLKRRDTSIAELRQAVDKLKGLTDDNTDQRERVARLSHLADDGAAYAVSLTTLRQQKGFEEAARQVMSEGPQRITEMRAFVAEMRAEEQALLERRQSQLHSSAKGAMAVFYGLALVGFLLLGAIHLIIRRDLTKRKQAELALIHSEAELKARTLQLESTNRELESFSYSVSHDLRAPLRGVDGFSQALEQHLEGKLDETGRHYMERIRAAIQRMGQLIDELLQLSRIARAPLARANVDLSALAYSIASELQESEPERKVAIEIEKGLTARGDGQLLRIALANLIANAWKFTSRSVSAHIEVGQKAGQHPSVYFVKDDGAGFEMAYADKLFGVFQRLHDDADFPGIGIGLATVQRIVQRHGGQIWAEARPGEGATFFFSLSDGEGRLVA